MGTLMGWVYTAISQIMLAWHGLWDLIFPSTALLATNWQWILAIVFLVVTVRAIMFPIFVKQIKSQRAMSAIQPKIAALREKHRGDKETLNREMTELMRKENANPLMGCLPMFLQIPVFLGLLHVLRHLAKGADGRFSEHQMTLYGWTVGAFESASKAKLFGAPISADIKTSGALLDSLHAQGWVTKLMVILLTLAMAGTSYLTSRQMIRKTGPATDPQQKMMQNLMLYFIPASALFTGLVYGFPIGVILYWVVNNLLSLAQQHWVMKKYPLPATATAGASGAAPTKATNSSAATRATKPTDNDGKGMFGRLSSALSRDPKDTVPAKDTPRKAGGASANGQAKGAKGAAANGKAPAKGANGSNPAQTPKAAAPRPGAKPVNPKKGPAKRTNK